MSATGKVGKFAIFVGESVQFVFNTDLTSASVLPEEIDDSLLPPGLLANLTDEVFELAEFETDVRDVINALNAFGWEHVSVTMFGHEDESELDPNNIANTYADDQPTTIAIDYHNDLEIRKYLNQTFGLDGGSLTYVKTAEKLLVSHPMLGEDVNVEITENGYNIVDDFEWKEYSPESKYKGAYLHESEAKPLADYILNLETAGCNSVDLVVMQISNGKSYIAKCSPNPLGLISVQINIYNDSSWSADVM